MTALDTSVLVYAHRPEFPLHVRALDVVRVLVEFAATVSHPRKFVAPSAPIHVRAQIEAWLESPSLRVLYDGSTVLRSWLDLVEAAHVGGPLHHDARIAATCLANGVTELWTADRDYLRFPALRVRNPLVS